MKITAGRDKFGKKPLFYIFKDGIFILSSEEIGILDTLKKIKPNKSNIANYFLIKIVLCETFFKVLKKLHLAEN